MTRYAEYESRFDEYELLSNTINKYLIYKI